MKEQLNVSITSMSYSDKPVNHHLSDIQSQVLSLTHTGGVGLPGHRYSLSLAGSTVGDEGLTEAVFMNRTLTHVRHTRPTESTMTKTSYRLSSQTKRSEDKMNLL